MNSMNQCDYDCVLLRSGSARHGGAHDDCVRGDFHDANGSCSVLRARGVTARYVRDYEYVLTCYSPI